MLTVQAVKDHLGIDWSDEVTDRRLSSLIETARAFMKGGLGADFPESDYRVKEMMLITIEDLYDRRVDNAKLSANTQRLFDNFTLQIQLEMRGV